MLNMKYDLWTITGKETINSNIYKVLGVCETEDEAIKRKTEYEKEFFELELMHNVGQE